MAGLRSERHLIRAIETAEAKLADAVRRLDEAEKSGRGDPDVMAISRAHVVPALKAAVEKARKALDAFYARSRRI